jgi:predicted Zn-dependent protease with MMP-like domain
VNLSVDEFERLVEEALASLPKRFADVVRNVVIAVEDEPDDDDLATVDDDEHGDEDDADGGQTELLGIYRGVPLTQRGIDDPYMPDEIAIFRGPINRFTHSRAEAVDEIRETVIHELGHYFGLTDEDMPH